MRGSDHYHVQPYLLDRDHHIWHLPYHLCLSHTVEEIYQSCIRYQQDDQKLQPIIELFGVFINAKRRIVWVILTGCD